MHYRLVRPADAHAAAVLQATLEALQQDRTMQRDLAHLQKACCGESWVRLAGAAKN